ncbi:probable serine/threonine-protein kinase PRP4 homolog at C-terminar half [Coccomyxa sp. Obi]|nr:probable serine/threonine-protein kinase PRP4 homolog at C-terminar half [Coccomyxa sp. Obi]
MDCSTGDVLEQGEDVPVIKKHHKEKKDKKSKHKHKSSHKKKKIDKSNNGLEGTEKVADELAGKGHAAKDLHEVKDVDNGKAAGYDSSPESGEIPVDAAVDEDVAEKKVQEGDSGEAVATVEPGVSSGDALVNSEMATDVDEARVVLPDVVALEIAMSPGKRRREDNAAEPRDAKRQRDHKEHSSSTRREGSAEAAGSTKRKEPDSGRKDREAKKVREDERRKDRDAERGGKDRVREADAGRDRDSEAKPREVRPERDDGRSRDRLREDSRRRDPSSDRRRRPEEVRDGHRHGSARPRDDGRGAERERPRSLVDPRDGRDVRGYPGRDRDRDRDRDRLRDRGQDLGRGREAGRDRHDRDGDRGRDRDRGRERDRSRERGRAGERRREPERKKTKEELEEEARRDAELEAQMVAALNGEAEDEDEKLINERRRKRQEILAKHQLSESVAAPTASELRSNGGIEGTPGVSPYVSAGGPGASPAGPSSAMASPSSHRPIDAISRPASTANMQGDSGWESEDEDMEATKLDQNVDLWQTRRDEADAAAAAAAGAAAEAGAAEAGAGPLSADAAEPGVVDTSDERKHKLEAQAARANDGLDMFAEQVDVEALRDREKDAVKRGLLDNYDDVEGYYNFQVGEMMDGRYEVFATHGKGVFSTVLRARDKGQTDPLGRHPEVAVKVIRANEVMFKAGQTETVILRKLSGADPEGKRHVVRLLRTFEYRQHLCLVFENMDINLRELTKKYGRGIGLNIEAVRAYAAQMLMALAHLRNCGVLHADIKPDNILVSASRTMVKLCDFGSAMFTGDNETTPYLVSRFYRAPEVILGLKYDHPMDMWSVGCVIYELYTGKILFPGKSNNEMLKLFMDVKGPFPKKMLKRGAFVGQHFEDDPNTSFALQEEDPVTKRPVRRLIANPTVKKDFTALLAGSQGEKRKLAHLSDLLERVMNLDPDKRPTPKEALRHPFFKDAAPRKGGK